MADMDFKQVLIDANIPTTQTELDATWRDEVVASGSQISNDSAYSPFWRAMTALVTLPALWLIDLLSNTILPNAFLKTAQGAFVDLLADGVNVTRKTKTKAQGVVTFTRSNVAQATTIPAGTIIKTASLAGKVYEVVTLADAGFVDDDATLDVAVEAVDYGTAYNLAEGYYSVLVEPINNIDSVANGEDWLTRPGTIDESDDDLKARARNQFGLVSDFHTDAVYRALIASFPGVAVDAIWFEHDAPRGPGTANAYVLFDFAAPITQYLVDINHYITDLGNHGHGDDLLVLQMPEQDIDLGVEVFYSPDLTAKKITALQTNVDTFIKAAFRENTSYSPTLTYPYSRFSFSVLDREIHDAFPDVVSINYDSSDIVSELWIPRLDSLTITMTENV